MATNTAWNVCATATNPPTAKASQIASPIHMAATNGSTLRKPLVRTRATRAATLGPGEPAAMTSAPAKTSSDETSMRGQSKIRYEESQCIGSVRAGVAGQLHRWGQRSAQQRYEQRNA